MHLRRASAEDASAIQRLAVVTGLMTAQEAQHFAGEVSSTDRGDTLWACAVGDDAGVVASAFGAREAFSNEVWNLLMLAVEPTVQGQGVGRRLLRWFEGQLAGRATALVIETSGQEAFAPTRSFYAQQGYRQVGVIPDYYAPGDSKVTFWRSLA